MAAEREPQQRVSTIHIDLSNRSVTLASETEPLARISLDREGIIFESLAGRAVGLPGGDDNTATAIGAVGGSPAEGTDVEREHTVVLSGRLRGKPREGRPDGRGNPTAWARFAAHVEGRETAHLYSTTFHRHTARIVLGLASGAPLTVEGYMHPQPDADTGRMDAFSVVNLLDYPGKPDAMR